MDIYDALQSDGVRRRSDNQVKDDAMTQESKSNLQGHIQAIDEEIALLQEQRRRLRERIVEIEKAERLARKALKSQPLTKKEWKAITGWLSTDEVQDVCCKSSIFLSIEQIGQLCTAGHLKHQKYPPHKHGSLFIEPEDVNRWIGENKQQLKEYEDQAYRRAFRQLLKHKNHIRGGDAGKDGPKEDAAS